ncbi:exodeoxyribonuclease VII large subunit [Mucilaginibacter sp. SG564]|uniref:exodeoxyribonuclease VII large subunit n=1 Tax=Mucilaginibacter sp. SG564 TaxID=2587022 RepID=UPI0015576BA4|nr:exodeoxyribonuclease VII large subunit [Mucilaginibacter sp. SG564]NOW96103.1 exodeoxyribonuclease VII large subunit [Mucilaginibacter sp. SG564]
MEAENLVTYSPAAVLNLFNNSISVNQTKRIIQLKGIYVQGKGSLYSGYYYDTFRDESSYAAITILAPPLIRNELQPNKTITVNGFITRRIVNTSGSIQIQLTVTDLVEQTLNKYSDEEIKKIELMQRKANAGYRDVYSWLKEKIINEEPFKIGIIIGKTGIIDNDIKHQLRESIGFYHLSFHRVNLSSEAEILSTIDRLNTEHYGLIAISRGGGENLDIFNQFSLAEKAITSEPLFITAIGHKDDVTLLQKVADKSFITPSELGQFLNDTYNHTVEELQNSRAKLIDSVKAQLTANYQKEIDNLNEKLKANEELRIKTANDLEQVYKEKMELLNSQLSGNLQLQNEKVAVLNEQINAYKAQISGLENKTGTNWTLVIIAIVLGVLIGYLLNRH